ncbi:borealin [Erpetoichthys calabaricus]|uniref:Borealin n=1 Tax=Erpetoichthys calabaricus TaxID=27687 RepID=A0A8C4TI74_ERPCA|nr:borealin [Erpetoichthys calabaricus]XP_051791685.1 borealin [Erpetoichthys calabaricus]
MGKSTRGRKNAEKERKMAAFLKDYDSEVESILEALKVKRDNLHKEIENTYNLAIIKLPLSVRQMKWIDYFAAGGQSKAVEAVAKAEANIGEDINFIAELKTQHKSALKATCKKGNGMASDEENVPPDSILKKVKPSTKKPPTSKKKVLSVKLSSGIRKSNRKAVTTPGRATQNDSIMGLTTFVTPHLEPRLMTSTVDNTKRCRKKACNMTVNESSVLENEVFINIPMKNGTSIHISANEMHTFDPAQLDPQTLGTLKMLLKWLTK